MNIFVETTSLDEIRRVTASGFADGIVISNADASPEGIASLIDAIAQEFAIPICVEVGAIDANDMYREARELAKISDHIIVQLPLVEDAIAPMHRLSIEGVGVCAQFRFQRRAGRARRQGGSVDGSHFILDLDAQGQTSADAVS